MKPVRTSLFWKLGLTYLVLLLAVLVSVNFCVARIFHGNAILSAMPLAQINQGLANAWRTSLEISFVVLLIGIGATLLVSRRYVSRVQRLEEFSRRVADGDFRPLPQESGKDELGDLVRSLNGTAARLNATIQSLTEERDRSAAILRSMVEGIAVVDARERVTFCNQAFAKIWDVGSAVIENKPAVEVIRQTHILELIRQALAGGEILHGEISLGIAQPRSFSVTVAPIRSFNGVITGSEAQQRNETFGAVVVLHEITDLRRIEQVRKDFVANVSHELRTPLTAIQGFAETLLTGALEDQQNNRHFVEIIRNHAARLSRLTDDLLKLSRIEAGKLDMDFQAVDLEVLIGAAVESARGAAKKNRLSLAVASVKGIPPILGDASLLREVMRNLLDNAIQYTPAGGSINVSAVSRQGFMVITVADTGIGIPQADQVRIFERFYRVDAARSREVGGTGLGLAIAKHIVEAHGGQIWVESTVAEGSQFHFSLPVAA
ncbi:MAG: ATP-binding protein [Candidatus Acidiferrales bacterium]